MYKLLIAEHSDELRTLLQEVLANEYHVTVCSSGKSALRMLNSIHPDILILDLVLPELDGLSLLEQSQYLPPWILCTTTILSEHIIQSAIDLGVRCILRKPFSVKAIVTGLSELIIDTHPLFQGQ